MDSRVIIAIFAVIAGVAIGLCIRLFIEKQGLSKATQKSEEIIRDAQSKAQNHLQQANIEAQQHAYDLKVKAEEEIKVERGKLRNEETKLLRKEDSLNFKEETLLAKERKLQDKIRQLDERNAKMSKLEEEKLQLIQQQQKELERVSHLSEADAKTELMDTLARKCEKQMAQYIHDKQEEAEQTALATAKNIIAMAINRVAQDETQERTVSTVTLPSEDMKGRIIGREGRNIKAIEQATGVDIIIDDTPDVLTISCFDPIRREIARQALETLMKDGRIQPGRIEEVVEKTRKDLNETIMQIGNEAIFKLGIGRMHKEMIRLVGTMRFRYSYGQNALDHSIEVAQFAGIMAAELGLNQNLAKRAGLLHDIGKAIDFEQEGSHIELGSKYAKKYGESPVVINSIEAHHGEVEPNDIITYLVIAADTLSAARPGARYEAMEGYVNRLESLEKIAKSYEGVEKAYAIQAGREIRVMVEPEKVDDIRMYKIAQDIRERIENEMTYPGQIKVTLIREVRVQELAK